MTEILAAIVVYWAFCGALGLVADGENWLVNHPLFHPGVLLVMLALIGWGKIEDGVARLRQALPLLKEAEDRASLYFRIAELLERNLGRVDDARSLLREAERALAGTRFEDFARDRIARL